MKKSDADEKATAKVLWLSEFVPVELTFQGQRLRRLGATRPEIQRLRATEPEIIVFRGMDEDTWEPR